MHILPNISLNKENQAIKFGELIEYNMRNILLENNTQNVVEKLFYKISKYFSKNQDWVYLWINGLNLYKFVFILC